jgi:hypothetical protein
VLSAPIEQEFGLSLRKRYFVKEISLYLVNFNRPSGEFTLEIHRDSQVIFQREFSSDDIIDQLGGVGDYSHSWFFIPCDLPLSSGSYIARLGATNYTYSEESFIAWAIDWQGFAIEEISSKGLERACGIRLITYDDPSS